MEVRGGAVTLRGLVGTFYERQLALASSARVAGVRELVDEIIVKELAPQRRMELSRQYFARGAPLAVQA